MKKFMTIAAMFAAVMMSFSSCEKDNSGKNDGGKDDGGNNNTTTVCEVCGEDPCVCEEEPTTAITIDGDFSDWDAVQTVGATCAEGAKWTALKSVKVYVDQVYINVLIEVDEAQVTGNAPIDIYINADNSQNPGNNNWLGQSGQDYLLEGAYYADGQVVSFDPGLYPYTGSDQEVEWAWDTANPLMPDGSGVASGAGTVGKYEIAIIKEMLMGVELADEFAMGITVSQNWEPVGLLPNDTVTDENTNGANYFLVVKDVK